MKHALNLDDRVETPVPPVIFRDVVLESILDRTVHLQASRIPFLITGESGVGKDYVAHRIHANGPRRHRPMVAVDLGMIPYAEVETELFGRIGGSRTGGKPGLFRKADKGTLLLDGVGELPPDLQAALLRVLDTGEIVPGGGFRRVAVDVHVIAASEFDLSDAVRAGTFRRDLHSFLDSVHITVPPLRDRQDKMRLILHLLSVEREALGITSSLQLSSGLWGIFLNHPWPGNIRELRNLLRSLIAVARTDVIEVSDLPRDFLAEMSLSQSWSITRPNRTNGVQASKRTMASENLP